MLFLGFMHFENLNTSNLILYSDSEQKEGREVSQLSLATSLLLRSHSHMYIYIYIEIGCMHGNYGK